MESLVACWVLLGHWNFVSIFLDDTVERPIVQPVVSWWEWEIETACSQLVFQFSQIAPEDEKHLFQLSEAPRFSFETAICQLRLGTIERSGLLSSMWQSKMLGSIVVDDNAQLLWYGISWDDRVLKKQDKAPFPKLFLWVWRPARIMPRV